jgi:hypothetical protein
LPESCWSRTTFTGEGIRGGDLSGHLFLPLPLHLLRQIFLPRPPPLSRASADRRPQRVAAACAVRRPPPLALVRALGEEQGRFGEENRTNLSRHGSFPPTLAGPGLVSSPPRACHHTCSPAADAREEEGEREGIRERVRHRIGEEEAGDRIGLDWGGI